MIECSVLREKIWCISRTKLHTTVTDVRTRAFFNGLTKSAEKKLYTLFMKRHPKLALTTPENTRMARAKGFNLTAVRQFLEQYESFRTEYDSEPRQISNMDETDPSNVQRPSKVTSSCGKRLPCHNEWWTRLEHYRCLLQQFRRFLHPSHADLQT